jgi:shikimate kinase
VKILICGFMGSGKSTLLAKFYRNSLGFECLDLDEVLAKSLGIDQKQLGDWIEKNGWEKFRRIESAKIAELLISDRKLVIALGGGTLNRELVESIKNNPQLFLIHLDVTLETCLERIKGDQNRPLLKMNLTELESIYNSRCEIFSLADLTLSSDDIKSIDGLETLVHNLSSL